MDAMGVTSSTAGAASSSTLSYPNPASPGSAVPESGLHPQQQQQLSTAANTIIPKMRRRSTQDISTPLKSSSASFVYTTPEMAPFSYESSPKNYPASATAAASLIKGNAGKELNLKLMGGRVVDISMEQLLSDVDELFEVGVILVI